MYILLITLITIVSILLILIILIQNPKGGLSENFASGNQVFGTKTTTDFVEKMTFSLILSLFVLVFISVIFNDSFVKNNEVKDEIQKEAPANN